MRESCSVCGLPFYREQGYFVGAMYISYFLAGLIGVPIALALFLAGIEPVGMVAGAAAVLFPLTPWLFQYSRILWLHFDHYFDPA